MNNKTVRTRFAPSPTGFLHVGGLRTALFNFLWARKNKGDFILRIEDTDREREVVGATQDIVETLKIFGLDFNEGPVQQSDRLQIYGDHIQILLDKGAAYKCYCSAERIAELKKQAELAKAQFRYDKNCLRNGDFSTSSNPTRDYSSSGAKRSREALFVIRQNVPEEGSIEFDDAVYGKISVQNRTLDDGILMKSDGWPVYNFANVVDDHLMKISHVIRGEEFISSTPKHILLYRAFGWEAPQFAHLPLLLSRERKKLSKRDGDVAVKEYLAKGYVPEALLNFVAFLGWNPKTERELFTLEELIAEFDLKKINRAGAVFDTDKLDWFNAQYLRLKNNLELVELIKPHLPQEAAGYPDKFLEKILEIERERLKTLSEIGERVSYFFAEPEYDAELLIWKKSDAARAKTSLEKSKELISNFQFPISKEGVETDFFREIGEEDKGAMLWPLRVALTGLKASPGPFEIVSAFGALPNGQKIIIERIEKAIEKLSQM